MISEFSSRWNSLVTVHEQCSGTVPSCHGQAMHRSWMTQTRFRVHRPENTQSPVHRAFLREMSQGGARTKKCEIDRIGASSINHLYDYAQMKN